MRQSRVKSEEAVLSTFTAIIFLAFLLIVGLISEGSAIREEKRNLFDIAAAAARAASQEVDPGKLRSLETVVLNAKAAEQRALGVLREEGLEGSVLVSGNSVTVVAEKRVDFRIFPSTVLTASRTAKAVAG